MLASKGGHLDVTKLLLAKGSLVDAVNNDGWTALMRAGARADRTITDGKTALALASEHEYSKIVSFIQARIGTGAPFEAGVIAIETLDDTFMREQPEEAISALEHSEAAIASSSPTASPTPSYNRQIPTVISSAYRTQHSLGLAGRWYSETNRTSISTPDNGPTNEVVDLGVD
ncbi:hypothetical protein BDV98DRAFT_599293 [Pterulicium gracile]|uniref:Uncharacterized protein n=1 Tax=Pterulicium gracile TaxID=1884261 RepID=A0A5C3R6R9_9AGAR|nr:hypothetical protein BDV98DRAFT_599293 [Pterula gracilis]